MRNLGKSLLSIMRLQVNVLTVTLAHTSNKHYKNNSPLIYGSICPLLNINLLEIVILEMNVSTTKEYLNQMRIKKRVKFIVKCSSIERGR